MTRPKITVVNYYNIFPVNNGGKLAILGFYKALSEWFDITLVCLSGFYDRFVSPLKLTNHLTVVSLALPDSLVSLDAEVQKEFGVNIHSELTDIMTIIRGGHCCSELIENLKNLSTGSSIIITEHVYTYRLVRAIADKREDLAVWYRAQNVEYDYKIDTWGIYNLPSAIYNEIFSLEKACCEGSDLILTITDNDAKRFCELYDADNRKILNISAGYDAESIRFTLPSKRIQNAGNGQFSALYISSSAQVAVNAADRIADAARAMHDVYFYIAGAVGSKMKTDSLTNNVKVLGLVSDEEKIKLLETCDFALNPISGGSGLNIKMLEYFASGIPVITTDFGARGIAVEDGVNCLVTGEESIYDSIRRFSSLSFTERDNLAIKARELYLDNYTWRNCAIKAVSFARSNLHLDIHDADATLDELTLIIYKEQTPFIPTGKIYIYGAGEWGKACLSFMRSKNITPVAFIDRDKEKWGKIIGGVIIQSPDDVIAVGNDCYIIFALYDFTEAVMNFLIKGINPRNIIVGMYGTRIFRLSDGEGCVPYFISIDKLQKEAGF